MKKIGTALIIIGIFLLMCATGKDDYYAAAHMYYSMKELLMWVMSGFTCIWIGSLIRKVDVR